MSVLIWVQIIGTLIVFLKECFEKLNLKKYSRQQKLEKLPRMQSELAANLADMFSYEVAYKP